MERRHDLPSAALLDLGHVKLQQTVEPCQQFLSVFVRSALVCSQDNCNNAYLDSPMLEYAQTLCVLAVMIVGAHVNKRVQMRFSG